MTSNPRRAADPPAAVRAGTEQHGLAATALVLGGDVGGTSTRVMAADLAGHIVGTGRGAGGNPTSHRGAAASGALSAALSGALRGLDAGAVRTMVFGMAGGGALRDPAVAAVYDEIFRAAGLTVRPQLVGDALIAFCSATPAPDGTILLAGTGAAAAQVRNHEMLRVADGLGWLLGDAGSGYWLGREAVRQTIRALGTPAQDGPLAGAVLVETVGQQPPADADPVAVRADIIRLVADRAPVELSRLAPLVTAAARRGDPVALDICRWAAELLAATIAEVHPRDDAAGAAPLVLNGSVVRDPASPVGSVLRSLLADRFRGPVLTPRDGTIGAVWLAVRAAAVAASLDVDLAAVHANLLATDPAPPDPALPDPAPSDPAPPDPVGAGASTAGTEPVGA